MKAPLPPPQDCVSNGFFRSGAQEGSETRRQQVQRGGSRKQGERNKGPTVGSQARLGPGGQGLRGLRLWYLVIQGRAGVLEEREMDFKNRFWGLPWWRSG